MKIENYKIKEKNIDCYKLSSLSNNEMISLLKTDLNLIFNARDKNGIVVTMMVLGPINHKTFKRIMNLRDIGTMEEYRQTKKYRVNVKGDPVTFGYIEKAVLPMMLKKEDVTFDIVILKKDYNRYAELLMSYNNINNDVLKNIMFFSHHIDSVKINTKDVPVSYFEMRYPNNGTKPRVDYFFGDNNSLLRFDSKGFNIIANSSEIRSIKDVIC